MQGHILGSRNMLHSMRRASANLTISDYSATFYPGDEEVDNTVFYGLHTADYSHSFYFSIFIAEGKHDVELGKTYTLADMEEGYNEWDDEDWNERYYTEASFTKTKGKDYDVHISVTVTDEDGVITIDAVNFNGKKINSVIGSTGNGISRTISQKATNGGVVKHLEKGRLVIEKNGQRFNALGIDMK